MHCIIIIPSFLVLMKVIIVKKNNNIYSDEVGFHSFFKLLLPSCFVYLKTYIYTYRYIYITYIFLCSSFVSFYTFYLWSFASTMKARWMKRKGRPGKIFVDLRIVELLKRLMSTFPKMSPCSVFWWWRLTLSITIKCRGWNIILMFSFITCFCLQVTDSTCIVIFERELV